MGRKYEIRDPIHGFVQLNELEWDLINQPSFQRLRRIRQLAWTDMVYPAAMHTRFEHSLGVMHVASRLFDALVAKSGEILRSEFQFEEDGLGRQKQIIRLAALLHDLGHGPFSHAAEEVLPINEANGRKYEHEDYSGAVIRIELKDVIEEHQFNRSNYGITIKDINLIFSDKPSSPKSLIWKDLVSGQMDADRMDYLLRDAYHSGVSYGHYDLNRVVNTVRLCKDPEDEGFHVGVGEDGIHAVEGLLIARYMMFTQLYFHKTRTIYDFHLVECLREILKTSGGTFPSPEDASIKQYLKWDDWRVLGAISNGEGGLHGSILHNRKHYRQVYATKEDPDNSDLERYEEIASRLTDLGCVRREAKKSWYKFQNEEIFVEIASDERPAKVVPLSTLSPVVKGLKTVNQHRLYVPKERRHEAEVRLTRH